MLQARLLLGRESSDCTKGRSLLSLSYRCGAWHVSLILCAYPPQLSVPVQSDLTVYTKLYWTWFMHSFSERGFRSILECADSSPATVKTVMFCPRLFSFPPELTISNSSLMAKCEHQMTCRLPLIIPTSSLTTSRSAPMMCQLQPPPPNNKSRRASFPHKCFHPPPRWRIMLRKFLSQRSLSETRILVSRSTMQLESRSIFSILISPRTLVSISVLWELLGIYLNRQAYRCSWESQS